MANLKHDLDEYLLLQSDQKKTNFKIDMKMPSIKVPEIKNLFGKSQPQEVNGWLEETKESCCPKLVCVKCKTVDASSTKSNATLNCSLDSSGYSDF